MFQVTTLDLNNVPKSAEGKVDYSNDFFGVDINKLYIPHGFMIGAGLVAGVQIILILFKKKKEDITTDEEEYTYTRSEENVRKSLIGGFLLYIAFKKESK